MKRFLQYLAILVSFVGVLGVLAYFLYTGFGRYVPPARGSGGLVSSAETGTPVTVTDAEVGEQGVIQSDRADPAREGDESEVVPADPLAEVDAPMDIEGTSEKSVADVTTVFSDAVDMRNPTLELIDRRVRKGEWSKALELCEQVLKDSPGRNDVRLRLAGIYVARGKVNDGYRQASRVLADDPGDARANLFMGEVMLKQALPSLALTYAEKAATLNPGLIEAKRLMGRALMAEGSFVRAGQMYEQLVQVRPNDLDVLMGYANACDSLGDTQRAGDVLAKAAELQPTSPGVHLVTGHHYLKVGDKDAAIMSYRKVLELTSTSVVALNNLASLLAEKEGQEKEAMRLASMAWQLSPGSPAVADTLGWLHYGAGDYRRAAALLATAVRKRPQDSQIRYHLAKVLLALERPADAERELITALKTGGTFKDVDAARALLNKIQNNELTTE
ncbi:MAG: tetratricopeptide repeat protein [Kiritimatiellae bacterium]|nr:tetratricopeptide repeat protein [Kiritimatiellia bacterium]